MPMKISAEVGAWLSHTEDHRFPEELALEAVRQFMQDHRQVPTAELRAAAGLTPNEKTIRRRFGSFRVAARLAGNSRDH